jgi:hypothetical protein
VLGKVVRDFPMVVKVKALDVKTMGETRLFFSEKEPELTTTRTP